MAAEGSDSQKRAVNKETSAAATRQPCGFADFFRDYKEGPLIHKWPSYFPVYEELFGQFCGASGRHPLRMLEWGVQSGGSIVMWREAFKANLETFVGADINPLCKPLESLGGNVKVRIGSQADPKMLEALKNEFPEGFDIILDDASHVPWHIFTTFVSMWDSLRPGGVYLIEDLHGRNPVVDWILRGHKLSEPKVSWEGVVYPGAGDIGPSDEVPTEERDTINTYPGDASRVQRTIESVKIYPYMLAITKRSGEVHMKPVKKGTVKIPLHP